MDDATLRESLVELLNGGQAHVTVDDALNGETICGRSCLRADHKRLPVAENAGPVHFGDPIAEHVEPEPAQC